MLKKSMIMAAALVAMMGFSANAQNLTVEPQQNKMYQPREFTEFAFEGILLDVNQQARIDSLNAAVKANVPQCGEAMKCEKAQAQCPKDKQCDKAQCRKDKQCDKAQCPKDKQCDKAQCPKDQICDKAQCPKDKQCDKAQCPKDKKCDKGECSKDKKCDKGECPKGKKGDRGPKHGKGHHGMGPQAACPYGDEYIAKVKEILTPEQYTVFLENIVSMPGHGRMIQNPHGLKSKDGKCAKDGKCVKEVKGGKVAKAKAK